MNALLRKEIRLLLPFWALAIFLATVPSWIVPRSAYITGVNDLIFWAFGFGLVLLSLAPFGQEFSLGTFSSLLAQPLARIRIWRAKILLITIAALLVFAAFTFAIHLRFDSSLQDELQRFSTTHEMWTPRLQATEATERLWYANEFRHACEISVLILLVTVTGGFWATLLFRQTGAALWFVILIPGALYVVIEGVLQAFIGHGADILLAVILSLYSLAGFVWARRMFLQAQDSQWLGETISLLALSPAKTQTDSATARTKGALRTLLRKELQSHQISLLIGFGLLVLHLCTLVFRKFYPMPRTSEFRFAIEAVPLLWLLIPWLIGSVSVAEERKLGTMESQLCLPVTRRLQFCIKFLAVIFLGAILGGFMPTLLEWLGIAFGVSSEIVLPRTTYFATGFEIVAVAAAISVISFFASTLTRNTLHALGAAIAIGGTFCAVAQWVIVNSYFYDYSLWKGPLIYRTELPVLTIAVLWLSFSNYKHLHAGQKVWARNLIILFSSFVIVGFTIAVVYQRPWELAMSLEPRHGTAQLRGPVRPKICLANPRLLALLPDGRLWVATDYHLKALDAYEQRWDERIEKNVMQRIQAGVPASGTFLAGSNWVDLAANNHIFGAAALQSDGSLWMILSHQNNHGTNHFRYTQWLSQMPEPRRIGSDTDWKTVMAGQGYFLALKTDGTLWNFGAASYELNSDSPRAGTPWTGSAPTQVGTNSDWARMFALPQEVLLMKNNGDIWRNVEDHGTNWWSPTRMNGLDWLSIGDGLRSDLVIRQDGSLWGKTRWDEHERFFGSFLPFQRTENLVRIGHDTDWAQLAGSSPGLFALKKDGRLVKNGTALFASTFNRPSQYSDWVAINMEWDEMAALAKDGTISLWKDTRRDEKDLLAISHRPLWSLNIFTDSKN